MGSREIIAIAISAIIIIGAIAYIIKAKRSGRKCIGCPDAATCKARTLGCHCHSFGSCNACEKEDKSPEK
ncbi:MAG: FeoB-associated Cys-rich membrane protein [Clostridia bacterium]|nr:FeoB-associated Cys-rich membrane protein [Clostridia bacterium]